MTKYPRSGLLNHDYGSCLKSNNNCFLRLFPTKTLVIDFPPYLIITLRFTFHLFYPENLTIWILNY